MFKIFSLKRNKNNKNNKKYKRADFKRKKILNKHRTKKFFRFKKSKKLKKIIYFLNIIFLLTNIILLFIHMQKHINSKKFFFKNSDYFNFNLIKRTYEYISSYLLNKYNTNNQKIQYNDKKIIKILVTGLFSDESNLNWFKERLGNKFILEYNSPNPDYIFYSVWNHKDCEPKYHNIIRIAIYFENFLPDINHADYFIAHPHIKYLDRYFKTNVFLWTNFKEIESKRAEVLNNPIRKNFCAAVISNCKAQFRLNFINKLSKYKKVDLGGSCYNNVRKKVKDKIKFLSKYKFSIAMENSPGDGYITEKIVDSFNAGTIPIYYGDYLVDEYVNPKTYILIKGEKDIDEKIEYIKKIDKDDKLYMEIMKEKPIIDDKAKDKIDKSDIKEFLSNIFTQDRHKAYRRDDNFYKFNPDLICQ